MSSPKQARMCGAALVELALLLPLLLLLTLGMAELGRALGARLALNEVSRAGAELAARGARPLRAASQDLMETLAAATVLDLRANGAIFITRIAALGGGPVVLEQYRWLGGNPAASLIAQCDASGACALTDAALERLPPLPEGAAIVAVEAHYRYAPLFGSLFDALFAGLAGEWCAVSVF